ncbi:isochorismate synthase [Rubidibacter lacunae KORDI 51-2]|uniref:isochorismate synthase n=1 Tax=Rubidibacter lacunae KORDI 51-2 TaxID=582515 RepID=U5DHU6_9CHRO|nr:isochorismate synthase [Rubidibacter lacunae]ERN40179.1 isochorismate synthase [Rubidibacter lacunae KORDI 51-2]
MHAVPSSVRSSSPLDLPFDLHPGSEQRAVLMAARERARRRGCPQVVVLRSELPPVDPLAVLQAAYRSDRLYGYWERRDRHHAIAAFGAAASATFATVRRFVQVREFVERWRARLLASEEASTPKFFCSFAFAAAPPASVPPPLFPAATVFLPHHQLERCGERVELTTHLVLSPQNDLDALWANYCRDLRAIACIRSEVVPTPILPAQWLQHRESRPERFTAGVSGALEAIAAEQLEKVVLARSLEVVAPLPLNPFASLDFLRRQHPDCFAFAVGNGRNAHFIGASPERLLSARDRHLVSDALAGSAPRGATPAEDARLAAALLASDKEQREHALVREFICLRLRQLGLSPQMGPLQLMQLANIQHLWTPVRALADTGHSIFDILSHLHPTPAVAGLPRARACDYIQSSEAGDRSLYAGPLGWADGNGNAEFVVGIRSAEVVGARARLCAGAGIVAGSDPQAELAEVQLKWQAMLRALGRT